MTKKTKDNDKNKSYFLSWQFYTPLIFELTAMYMASLSYNYYFHNECNSGGNPYILSTIIFTLIGLCLGFFNSWKYIPKDPKKLYLMVTSLVAIAILSFLAIAFSLNAWQIICLATQKTK